MFDWIKTHPIATGGIVVAGLVIIYLFASGGSSGSSNAPSSDQSAVAAGVALQQAQLQATTAAQNTSAQLQAELGAQSTQIQLAQIQGQYQSGANDVAAAIAEAQINAQEQTTTTVAALQSQTEIANINAQAQTAQAGIVAASQQTAVLGSILKAQIAAQQQTQMFAIQKQAACSGLGGLFGC